MVNSATKISLTCCWRSINGNSKSIRTASGKLEVEDGEIEDAKLSDQVSKELTPSKPQENVQLVDDDIVDSTPEKSIVEESMEPPVASQQEPTVQTISQIPFVPEDTTSRNLSQTRPQDLNAILSPTIVPAGNPSVPPRPDLNRNVSANPTNGRVQHSLPSRPEPPMSKMNDHRMPERTPERAARDHIRDPRFPERIRADRPGDASRDRPPDHNLPMTYPRGYDQNNERQHLQERNRVESGWGEEKSLMNRSGLDDRHSGLRRDARPTSRDDRIERSQRDRSFSESQHHLSRNDLQGQPSRDIPMAPPRSNISQHPDRAALIHGSQDPNISLNTQHSERRSDPSRYENYPISERVERSSRGASPARLEDRRHPRQDSRRDDRPPNDSRRLAESHSHASRYEESHLPTGPRTDRPITNGPPGSNDRLRDPMKNSSMGMPATDSSHGRLNQDQGRHNRQEESQYGRLNSGSDIPSGPRLPNGNHHTSTTRGNRNVSAPQPQNSYQQPQTTLHNLPPPLQIPDKETSIGPTTRSAMRNSSSFPQNKPASTPSTPANDSPDTAGVHPDRLKAIQGQIMPSVITAQSQGNMARSAQQPPSAIAASTPIGPRGPNSQLPSPVVSSPTTRGPPTGPSFTNDRSRGDKRFASLQNVLQQANGPNGQERSGQGASIRGRGGRANNINASPGTSGPSTPSIPRPDPYAPRADLFAGRSSGPPTPQHNEEEVGYSRGARRISGREMPRDGDRRSERHRSNRSHSREKTSRPPPPPRDDEMPPRREDLRDRQRGGPPEREMRRPTRDDLNRDRRPELDRREIPEWAADGRGGPGRDGLGRDERDRRDGGGSGRKRGRVGEEGPIERNYAENKRPRRIM